MCSGAQKNLARRQRTRRRGHQQNPTQQMDQQSSEGDSHCAKSSCLSVCLSVCLSEPISIGLSKYIQKQQYLYTFPQVFLLPTSNYTWQPANISSVHIIFKFPPEAHHCAICLSQR